MSCPASSSTRRTTSSEGILGRPRARHSGIRSSNTIAEYAPNINDIILHRQVVTPLDLEREWGLTEGNIFQGELTLEQLFFLRPAPGWARYRTPIRNLYMCGSATHPGRRHHGSAGKECGDADVEGERASDMRPIVIVGGGHNGLVAAYLPRDRRPQTDRRRAQERGRRLRRHRRDRTRIPLPDAAHSTGPLRPSVVRDLQLRRRVEFVDGDPRLCRCRATACRSGCSAIRRVRLMPSARSRSRTRRSIRRSARRSRSSADSWRHSSR